MVDPVLTRLWGRRALYAAVMVLMILTGLIPNLRATTPWPGPDLMLALTLCWLLRKPAQVPTLLIGAVFLLADFLEQQPLGVHTAMVVAVTEFVRSRGVRPSELTLLTDWAVAAFAIAAVMVGERIVLTATLVPTVGPGMVTLRLLATVLAYPLVVWAARVLLRVQPPRPGDRIGMGRIA